MTTYTIAAGASIDGNYNAVDISSAAATIDNFGTIAHLAVNGTNPGQVSDGVFLRAGAAVTNETSGLISGGYAGVQISGAAGTVDNSGTIIAVGNGAHFLAYAGVLLANGGAITNAVGGSISGATYGVEDTGSATVGNAGVITGGNSGIQISGAAGTVDNSGTITGTGSAGVYLEDGGLVTNETGGSIGGHFDGVQISGAAGTVDNSGTITGTGSAGVYLGAGGSITNAAGGSISGGSLGIYIKSTTGTVENSGAITATGFTGVMGVDLRGGSVINAAGGSIGGRIDGVYISVAAGTVENSGTISGTLYDGIYLRAGGSVSNAATGKISGGHYGLVARGSSATVENAGTISGSTDSVKLSATGANRLIVDPGAVFIGKVVGTGSGTTLELAAGSSVGTINGLGSQYTGIGTVTIDAGASWDVAGTKAAFAGTTIAGFNSHDRLDLTDLTFNGSDSATVNGSNQLVIADAGGYVTIQMDGGVSGQTFQLLNDGHGHTFAEETDYTPCYLKGTRIRTPDGDRPVEDLRIGDRVMTLDGEALPLKWIGRRSYRDWLAVGNADAQPILFKMGSISNGVPARDLYVSPEHAMLLDGVLVPACHLVNGVSVVKMEGMEEIDYFHLEFDRHVVIFAEDAPAESFVDDDSRMLFHNAEEFRRLYPGEPSRRVEFCAPRIEAGPALDVLRRTLQARARLLRPGGTAATPLRRGYVDRVSRIAIEGWAQGSVAIGEPARLAILVNGAVVGETLADQRRDDLNSSSLGNCGFRFVLPRPLSPDLSHRIEVRRAADWSLLHGGARVVGRRPGPNDRLGAVQTDEAGL